MKKILTIVVVFILFLHPDLYAKKKQGIENKDSVTIVNTKWNTVKIAKGITLKQAHFTGNLFESNQFISILEISPVKEGKKTPAFLFVADKPLTKTSELAARENAVVAVNGTFFSFKEPHNAVAYLKIGDNLICDNDYEKKNKRLFNQLGAIALNESGEISVLKADTADLNWEKTIQARDIMTSGPILIMNKQPESLQKASFYTTRHPRTAVAKTAKGGTLLITVDGRNAQAQGMSLQELQDIFKWLGVTDLINLDGGGSTTMYVQPQILGTPDTENENGVKKGTEKKAGKISHTNGIVNYPSDNKKFDHQGERKVANAVVVVIPE